MQIELRKLKGRRGEGRKAGRRPAGPSVGVRITVGFGLGTIDRDEEGTCAWKGPHLNTKFFYMCVRYTELRMYDLTNCGLHLHMYGLWGCMHLHRSDCDCEYDS